MSESQYSKAVIAAPFGTLLLEASDSHLLNIEVKIETLPKINGSQTNCGDRGNNKAPKIIVATVVTA